MHLFWYAHPLIFITELVFKDIDSNAPYVFCAYILAIHLIKNIDVFCLNPQYITCKARDM